MRSDSKNIHCISVISFGTMKLRSRETASAGAAIFNERESWRFRLFAGRWSTILDIIIFTTGFCLVDVEFIINFCGFNVQSRAFFLFYFPSSVPSLDVFLLSMLASCLQVSDIIAYLWTLWANRNSLSTSIASLVSLNQHAPHQAGASC